MKGKKLLALLLGVTLLMSPVQYAQAEGETEAPVNQEEHASGYIESDLDSNAPVYEPDFELCSILPVSYPDDGVQTLKDNYPAVRNQNPFGTCWAFSTMGLAEFDLINDGIFDNTIDLSELQLAYFTSHSVVDPLGGTQGDYTKYYDNVASENFLNYGGNYELAMRRLSQWSGAVAEQDVPYTNAEAVLNNGLDSSYAYSRDVAHLENVYRINLKSQSDNVKQQIMEHGAVGVLYTHYYSGENHINNSYFDSDTTSGAGGGHAVMVVGWDDNYSRDNFSGATKPGNNGAWLVRNSWGSDNLSYFWMSYETKSLNDTAWVFDFVPANKYDNNYQYDGALLSATENYYKQVANVYTVAGKQGVTSESLKAVSLSFMKTANVHYTIEVYTDLSDTSNPESGTKSATVEGNTAYAGYYTIPLENEVTLKPGSSYAVIVKTDKYAIESEYSYSEAKNPSDASTTTFESIASDNFNKDKVSFYYGYGRYALSSNNYRIKAFTKNNTEQPPAEQKYTVKFNANGGSVAITDKEVITGSTYGELPKPEWDGYTFSGWYTAVDAGNLVEASTVVELTADQTLYAHWTKNPVIEPEQPNTPGEQDKPDTSDKGQNEIKMAISTGEVKTEISVDDVKLKDTILSDEQKKIVADGGKANINIQASDITKNVSDQQKKMIASVLKSDSKVGMYADISVLLTVIDKNGIVITDNALIPEIATKIIVKMKLPEEFIQKNDAKSRTYQVVRVHDGVPEIIESKWDAETTTLSFETDKFSLYAIAYRDVDKTSGQIANPDQTVKLPEDQTKDQKMMTDTKVKQIQKEAADTSDDNKVLFMLIVLCLSLIGVFMEVNRTKRIH